MKTIAEILPLATGFLKNDRRRAEEVLAAVLGVKRIDLYMQFDRPLIEEELEEMRAALKRSAQGEPFEYIFGFSDFYGCRLEVTRDVLIPRPETELLVDLVVKKLTDQKVVWDLCCGSGCIGLGIKRARPDLAVTLSDLSQAACSLAQKNAQSNRLDVEVLQGDLLYPFSGRKADVIVCNPPYISRAEYEVLDESVRLFEPKMALVSGETGVEFYERLARELPLFLERGAMLFLEIGAGQGRQVSEIFEKSSLGAGTVLKDFSGRDRFYFLENPRLEE